MVLRLIDNDKAGTGQHLPCSHDQLSAFKGPLAGFLRHSQIFDVIINISDYVIKKLIMMQRAQGPSEPLE